MTNDSIADLLTRIRNNSMARRKSFTVPYTKVNYRITKILEKNNYLESTSIDSQAQFKRIAINIADNMLGPKKLNLVRHSKPGRRIYVSSKDIPVVLGGEGIAIVSTSQGIITGYDAYSRNIGGELLAKVW